MRDDPVRVAQVSSRESPGRETAPDKTSVFAHPVECFVSNFADKELLKRMPLKIGEHTAPYGSFFKKIEYLTDNKGLIYWGKIKEIKDYTQSFRIDFEQKVWFKQAGEAKKKPYSVNVYLSKKLIENYRKRKAFLEQIHDDRALIVMDVPLLINSGERLLVPRLHPTPLQIDVLFILQKLADLMLAIAPLHHHQRRVLSKGLGQDFGPFHVCWH